jgi:hypothetical protein
MQAIMRHVNITPTCKHPGVCYNQQRINTICVVFYSKDNDIPFSSSKIIREKDKNKKPTHNPNVPVSIFYMQGAVAPFAAMARCAIRVYPHYGAAAP